MSQKRLAGDERHARTGIKSERTATGEVPA
jgi:hypothetical protein